MRLPITLLFLGYSLVALSKTANGQENDYTFVTDLDSLASTNGKWQWSNRDAFPWALPDGPDGFAVHYISGDGDVLYDSEVDIQYGFDYEITYYISSEDSGTTLLKIQQLDVEGTVLQDIEEYQSDATSFEWVTVSGTFAASGVPSRFGVFCQSAGINFVNEPFYGCAIDSIALTAYPPPTTTGEPQTTTSHSTTSASGPTPTVDFNFDNGTDGWLLGNSNGASWLRESSFWVPGDVRPPSNYILRVSPDDVYSGTVLATSPRIRVGDSGVVSVKVDFFLNGTSDYPVYLKLRRRISYTTYDENVILNMDPWGDQVNTEWQSRVQTVSGLNSGEEFNLVLEGNLGINKDMALYQIMVSRVLMEGVTVVPNDETEIFDFSDGLVGWQAGAMDGGKWEVVPYADLPQSLNIPRPNSENLLMVDRYDIHSGVITIESPSISVEPGTTKDLQIRLFIRGSQVYPVIFRLGLRTLNGEYSQLPFVDLSPQGDANVQAWMSLATNAPIPFDPIRRQFQVVFEVDLGGDLNNLIAIDSFTIRTVSS